MNVLYIQAGNIVLNWWTAMERPTEDETEPSSMNDWKWFEVVDLSLLKTSSVFSSLCELENTVSFDLTNNIDSLSWYITQAKRPDNIFPVSYSRTRLAGKHCGRQKNRSRRWQANDFIYQEQSEPGFWKYSHSSLVNYIGYISIFTCKKKKKT